MKPQVAVEPMDSTVLEENSPRTPTVLGHQLEDLIRVVTVLAAPVAVAALIIEDHVWFEDRWMVASLCDE
jgi:hypothetical protein